MKIHDECKSLFTTCLARLKKVDRPEELIRVKELRKEFKEKHPKKWYAGVREELEDIIFSITP